MSRAEAHMLVSCGAITLGHLRTILRKVDPPSWKGSNVNAGIMQTDSLRIFRDAIATYKEISDAHVMDGKRDAMIAANIIREFDMEGIAAILQERP
jgi:hypothetical protein